MTYLICEAKGKAREPDGHYQHFTCGVDKQAKVPLPVNSGEKSLFSRSKWKVYFCGTIWGVVLVSTTLYHSVHKTTLFSNP